MVTHRTYIISFRKNSLLTGLRKILVFSLIAVHFFFKSWKDLGEVVAFFLLCQDTR